MPSHVQLSWQFDDCTRLQVYPWPEWREANVATTLSWSMEQDPTDSRWVFTLETGHTPAHYIVCDDIRVIPGHECPV